MAPLGDRFKDVTGKSPLSKDSSELTEIVVSPSRDDMEDLVILSNGTGSSNGTNSPYGINSSNGTVQDSYSDDMAPLLDYSAD